MTTTITIPRHLAEKLEQYAITQQRSAEAVAIEFIEAALDEQEQETLEELVARIKSMPPSPLNASMQQRSTETIAIEAAEATVAAQEQETLEELIARIKATPPNPNNIFHPTGNLADVLREMRHGIPDQQILDALVAAELELKSLSLADDIAEGRV